MERNRVSWSILNRHLLLVCHSTLLFLVLAMFLKLHVCIYICIRTQGECVCMHYFILFVQHFTSQMFLTEARHYIDRILIKNRPISGMDNVSISLSRYLNMKIAKAKAMHVNAA